ncbi:MAG: hypothetical protein Q8P45_03325 [Candidatus Harrisonbacteria bacterium]|nr:hypothetical protein [Candidatus Harrisonbacteria bacterium]
MPEFDFNSLFSGMKKSRRFSRRWWRNLFFRFSWTRKIGERWTYWRARTSDAPEPNLTEPLREEMMGFTICLWEGRGSYVATHSCIPGTKIELLRHFYCKRIVGIRIWD